MEGRNIKGELLTVIPKEAASPLVMKNMPQWLLGTIVYYALLIGRRYRVGEFSL